MTLTGMYNLLVEYRETGNELVSGIKSLDRAHRTLDEVVAAAYGWTWPLSDDELLTKLLEENLNRAALEEAQRKAEQERLLREAEELKVLKQQEREAERVAKAEQKAREAEERKALKKQEREAAQAAKAAASKAKKSSESDGGNA